MPSPAETVLSTRSAIALSSTSTGRDRIAIFFSDSPLRCQREKQGRPSTDAGETAVQMHNSFRSEVPIAIQTSKKPLSAIKRRYSHLQWGLSESDDVGNKILDAELRWI